MPEPTKKPCTQGWLGRCYRYTAARCHALHGVFAEEVALLGPVLSNALRFQVRLGIAAGSTVLQQQQRMGCCSTANQTKQAVWSNLLW